MFKMCGIDLTLRLWTGVVALPLRYGSGLGREATEWLFGALQSEVATSAVQTIGPHSAQSTIQST